MNINTYSNPYAEFLPGFLNLQTPGDSSQAPSIFQFERFRELSIDWNKITSQTNPSDPSVNENLDPIDDIQKYFEACWKSATPSSLHDELFGTDRPFYDLKGTSNASGQVFWKIADIYLNGDPINQHQECICLIHKPSERLYSFVDKGLNPATEDKLGWTNAISNTDAWLSIDNKHFSFSLIQAYEKSEDAKTFATTTTYTKREAILFKEEYERLNAQSTFVGLFNDHADGYIKGLFQQPERFQQFWNDEEELNRTADTYSNLQTKGFSIKQKMRQLAAKVKEYGYYLALAEEKVKVPDGQGGMTEKILAPGKIYQIKQDTYLRRDIIRRQQWKKIKDGKNTYWVKVWVEAPVWISTAFQNYVELDLLKDPVQSAIAQLKEQNFSVYFGELRNGGFFTEENIPLSNILRECERDEEFRRKCVVVIPQYDYLISNKSYYVGAFIFKYPLPGIVPTAYPRVGIREELSYKLAWKGIELGQLISSINLAPGETRTITVSSKFKQTTAQTASFKSVNDVNTSESFDLATEFQNEASREFNRNESFQASVSGGFGVGPFSASASASGSRSTNLKTFSKEMSRVAKKSAQSINRKISQEVTSTTTSTTEVSQETNKSITISNINKGTTLNLLFYQVNNKYEAATYLTGLELLVSSTKELIAGSGIYETYSYRTNEIWTGVFEKLHPDVLPGNNLKPTTCPEIPAPTDPEWTPEEPKPSEDSWCYYWRSLETKLKATLEEEYQDNGKPETAGVVRFNDSKAFDRIAQRVINKNGGLQKLYREIDSSREDEFVNGKNVMRILDANFSVCDYFRILDNGLRNIEILDDKALNQEFLLIASGGLYVDSMLGVMPATEPYSENMRKLETLRVQAEIDESVANTDEIRAKTNLLLSGDIFIKSIFAVEEGDTFLVLLQLTKGITDIDRTHWEVYFDNAKVDNCEIHIPGPSPAIAITITWPGELPQQEELDSKLFLRNKSSNQVVRKF